MMISHITFYLYILVNIYGLEFTVGGHIIVIEIYLGSSSILKDSKNPITANLLAQYAVL